MATPRRRRAWTPDPALAGVLVLVGALLGGLAWYQHHRHQERARTLEARGWRYVWRWGGYRVEGVLQGYAFSAEGRRGDVKEVDRKDDLFFLRLAVGGDPLWVGPSALLLSWDTWVGPRILAMAHPGLAELLPSTGAWVQRECSLPGALVVVMAPHASCPAPALAQTLLREQTAHPYRLARGPSATILYDISPMPQTGPEIEARIAHLATILAPFTSPPRGDAPGDP